MSAVGLLLAVLFIGVPALEIALLIKVGGAIGAGWTFLVVVATGIAGAAVAKRQGLVAVQDVQRAMATGQKVGRAMVSAVLLVAAAVFLITPGFVTDIVGFALLMPWLRRTIGAQLATRFADRVVGGGGFGNFPGGYGPNGPGAHEPSDSDEPPPPGVIDV